MGDALDGEYGDFRGAPSPSISARCSTSSVQGQDLGRHRRQAPRRLCNPFDGLDTHTWRRSWPRCTGSGTRADEFMIHQPMGQIWLWSSYAERLLRLPDYWEAFWTQPGHIGFDAPAVEGDLIDVHTTVVRPIFAKDLMEEERFQTPECAQLRGMAMLFAGMHNMWDTRCRSSSPTAQRLPAGSRSRLSAGRRPAVLPQRRQHPALRRRGRGEQPALRWRRPATRCTSRTASSSPSATCTDTPRTRSRSTTASCVPIACRSTRSTRSPRCRRSWPPATPGSSMAR